MSAEQPVTSVAPVDRVTDEWTVKRILDWTTEHLKKHGSDSARLDAEILLAHARGCKRIELYTRYDEPLTERQRALMRDLVRRRANAEPVAYLVGFKEFFSLPFKVTPDVLIPRPETETLVLEAVEIAKASTAERLTLLDLCTGSGCIAVAATKATVKFSTTATDMSEPALAIARRNAASIGVVERIEFRHGDLFDALPADSIFDVIVSNPPYVSDGEYETLAPDIRLHEPANALLAGADGMDVLRRIAAEAPQRLNFGGHLLVELDPAQANSFSNMLRPSFRDVRIVKDLAGLPRVVHAMK
ncbi:MAG: peptide chain release factor N(5)-glutamine methyltransferase [Planctomycetota bacterium]|nr:peptide chain release factor N(5)-glutamine methyltransferase [Planctomycetaceae bacterium]MDQ3330518.1 peptide chain release factor N(5)-glutamine methyltransferase [Planctomycetota bacterium]